MPVDSFILAINAIPYDMEVHGSGINKRTMLRASYLWYQYSNGAIIRIYVREYSHMNRYSPTGTWDVLLFRKEKIYKIEIWKNGYTCWKGDCLE